MFVVLVVLFFCKEIVENDDGYDFEVKEILKHKYLNGKLYYQVHFKYYQKASAE